MFFLKLYILYYIILSYYKCFSGTFTVVINVFTITVLSPKLHFYSKTAIVKILLQFKVTVFYLNMF